MRENPPQKLGYPVDPVNGDEGQGGQTSTRKLVQTTQRPEVEYSHVTGKCSKFKSLGTGKQGVSSHSTSTRKLVQTATRRTEFQNMMYTNHQYMTKVFHF